MNKPSSLKSETGDTPTKILDAAQQLFIARGYAATSLRSISTAAGVNLSATHYHFGSKEGLFEAVIDRHVGPLNAARLRALSEVQTGPKPNSPAQIVQAFLQPTVSDNTISVLPTLIARIFSEPEAMTKSLLQAKFGSTVEQFVTALRPLLPQLSDSQLRWRFHFLIGAMIHHLNFDRPLGSDIAGPAPSGGFAELLSFASAGLSH